MDIVHHLGDRVLHREHRKFLGHVWQRILFARLRCFSHSFVSTGLKAMPLVPPIHRIKPLKTRAIAIRRDRAKAFEIFQLRLAS